MGPGREKAFSCQIISVILRPIDLLHLWQYMAAAYSPSGSVIVAQPSESISC